MYIHIFPKEGNYASSFIQMLSICESNKEHFIIFRNIHDQEFHYDFNNIKYISGPVEVLFRLLPLLHKAKWIYIHYLPYGYSTILFLLLPKLLKKSTWVIWGGDAYIGFERKKDIKSKFLEAIRKQIIPKFPEIAAFVREDALKVKEHYHSNARYIQILYPLPIKVNELTAIKPSKTNNEIKVLVGNSADPSNSHREIFNLLVPFKKFPIKIICPLSYYEDNTYIQEVLQLGNENFGEKFMPLTEFMPSANYARLLATIDIGVMFHNRQQGLGTILPLLYYGKKVFIKKNTTSFRYLKEFGFNIFDTHEIKYMDYNEFSLKESTVEQANIQLAMKILSNDYYISLWKTLFTYH